MSEREDITTIRHFVYKAGKWNDSAEEYANDTGVYDALDRIETALAACERLTAAARPLVKTAVEAPGMNYYEVYVKHVDALRAAVATAQGEH